MSPAEYWGRTGKIPGASPLYFQRFQATFGLMISTMRFVILGWLFLVAVPARVRAGGSGLNVVVVANQASSNSLQLANYYCELRGIPPQNVLRITWTGGNTDWTRGDFETLLRAPLNALLAARRLTNQIEYVVLSMDLPYRVREDTGLTATSGQNGTTAALYYGFKPDDCTTCPAGFPSCNLPDASSNSYAASEGIFRQTPPLSLASNSWLVTMITSSNLAQAKSLAARGAASDGTFPTQTVWLAKSGDAIRNVRYLQFDNAIFDTRLRANYAVQTIVGGGTFGLGTMLGYQNGIHTLVITGDFAPGAMVDNLTSFGGYLFGGADQTGLLTYINAGATASAGTVVEPCAYFEKFASPQNYFYQARGFSVAESYYQSLTNPYQNILVGEPLAAPFAAPATGAWLGLPESAALAGTTNLALQFDAADATRPVQQVDLFVDGGFAQTLTNIAPRQNNLLYVSLNNVTTNYTVPANASLKSIASNLTVRLNGAAYANAANVHATAHGDRVQLQFTDLSKPGSQVPVTLSNSPGTATALTTYVRASGTNFLDTVALGRRGITIAGTVVIGDFLQLTATKTNGNISSVSITNATDGLTLTDFVQQFLNAINADASLSQADGLTAVDLAPSRSLADAVDFNLRPRTAGIRAAQMQAVVIGTFGIVPATTQSLAENLDDLQPRQHLYITAGLTNLPLTFGFNTTTQADGFHELTAVAYEGSHVRVQRRVSQTVRIQNSALSAVFTCLMCASNTALEATLQFAVAANTGAIARIELFSTGGNWGVVSNSATATFSLAATNLGAGLHPFYALVTATDGKQYRTETKWIRLLSDDLPFPLSVSANPPSLTWPASAGRRYEVLSTTNLSAAFVLRDSVVPTNSPGRWSETNQSAPERYYRLRTAPGP